MTTRLWLAGLMAVGMVTLARADDEKKKDDPPAPAAKSSGPTERFTGYVHAKDLSHVEVVSASDSSVTIRIPYAAPSGGGGGGRSRGRSSMKLAFKDLTYEYHADGQARTMKLPPNRARKAVFDWAGALLSILWITSAVLAASWAGTQYSWGSPVILGLALLLLALPATPALAQSPDHYSSNEILDAGHKFFGGVSRGLASVIERAFSTWGQPNGYVLGQEGGGAIGFRGDEFLCHGGGFRGCWACDRVRQTVAAYQTNLGQCRVAFAVSVIVDATLHGLENGVRAVAAHRQNERE